jgi:Xaa-Pro dipeptidase
MQRREFLITAAIGSSASAIGCTTYAPESTGQPGQPITAPNVPAAVSALKPMTAGVVPIAVDERRARIAKAQSLMERERLDAIFMEGTASCFYFAGMRWGQSERTFGLVIPAKGDVAYVCPGFEEDRARELIKPEFGTEVRTWQETRARTRSSRRS